MIMLPVMGDLHVARWRLRLAALARVGVTNLPCCCWRPTLRTRRSCWRRPRARCVYRSKAPLLLSRSLAGQPCRCRLRSGQTPGNGQMRRFTGQSARAAAESGFRSRSNRDLANKFHSPLSVRTYHMYGALTSAPKMRVKTTGSAGRRGRRICLLPIETKGPPAKGANACPSNHKTTREFGWGERIRTSDWLIQNQLPYHLATPQRRSSSVPDAPWGPCLSLRQAAYTGQ